MYRLTVLLCIALSTTWINAVSPPGPDTELEKESNELKTARQKCQGAALTRTNDEIERKLFRHEQLEPHEIEYHALCCVIELNLMKAHGEILIENVKTHLSHVIKDPHALEEQLHRCTETGHDALRTAMHLFFCMHDAMMTHHEFYSTAGIPLFGPQALKDDAPLNTAASAPNPNPVKPAEKAAGTPEEKPAATPAETPAAADNKI